MANVTVSTIVIVLALINFGVMLTNRNATGPCALLGIIIFLVQMANVNGAF